MIAQAMKSTAVRLGLAARALLRSRPKVRASSIRCGRARARRTRTIRMCSIGGLASSMQDRFGTDRFSLTGLGLIVFGLMLFAGRLLSGTHLSAIADGGSVPLPHNHSYPGAVPVHVRSSAQAFHRHSGFLCNPARAEQPVRCSQSIRWDHGRHWTSPRTTSRDSGPCLSRSSDYAKKCAAPSRVRT